ncbi:MAG: N-6 DNA methylase [Bacteroidales bacterium]
MNNIADIHSRLTSNKEVEDSKHLVLTFAKELGWNPSYFIEPASTEKSNGYLVVEHGLQNSAVISFLNVRNEDLTSLEEENLLAISYNNLVNWHITVDERYINYYFILNKEDRKVETKKIEIGNEKEALSVSTFYEIIGKKPNSNIKALDDVLIENISKWKRILSTDLEGDIDLVSLSHLFNAIIFLRSIEDGQKRSSEIDHSIKIFLDVLSTGYFHNITQIISEVERSLKVTIPEYVVQKEKILIFNTISISDIKRFCTSFYENDYNRFKYDFSIMTKHALSRIYQKYVSILSVPSFDQLNLFTPIPIEKINKDIGAYYTPEYVARFFSKYLCKNYTEKEFDSIKILEPAVGSGVFLRTILETQIEQRISNETELKTDILFDNVTGIDIDPNACLSTILSLTLLHYVFNKSFIRPCVIEGDSLKILKNKISVGETVDVVISNPPYINQDNKNLEVINEYKDILKGISYGKIDIYQAFIKLSIDLLKPNGLGLFVLPQNFLVAQSSKKLRNYLLEHCKVELLADLSSINVFDKIGTYTILLIFRKKSNIPFTDLTSWLLKCRGSVGEALNQVLMENESKEKLYQVYKTEDYFKPGIDWFLLNKSEIELLNKLKRNITIDKFLKISQGIVTGKDNVFIRDINKVKKDERSIYKAFLPDQEINSYTVESKIHKLVFYPFLNNKIIDEADLSSNFPDTWEYLNDRKYILTKERSDVREGKLLWWKLHSPGRPEYINSPKIISPYVSIFPKFALDIDGEFITSRSPFFILKDARYEKELLYYFLGILNSTPCYWSLSVQSQKQSGGYNIFHLNLLNTVSVPDPTLPENLNLVSKMILNVKRRIVEKNDIKKMEIERSINQISCDLYQLNPNEIELLGL